MDESFDNLLLLWREAFDDLQEDTSELRQEMEVLTARLNEIAAPYQADMAALEAEIKPRALAWASTYKEVPGVAVNYRKGYQRVSYSSDRVDTVMAVLKDLLPNAAESLAEARAIRHVSPSVSIKAV